MLTAPGAWPAANSSGVLVVPAQYTQGKISNDDDDSIATKPNDEDYME